MNNKNNTTLLQLESEQKKMMKGFNRWKGLFYFAMIGWVAFTATKVYDLTDLSRPPNAPWLPYLATAVVSGGFLIWLMVLENLARTDEQREVAIAMIVISWFAEFLMAVGDTVFRQSMFDITMSNTLKWIVVNMAVFVVMAFSAGAARFLALDPNAKLKQQLVKGIEIFMEARNKQIIEIAADQADSFGEKIAMDDLIIALGKHMGRDDISLAGDKIDLSDNEVEIGHDWPAPAAKK